MPNRILDGKTAIVTGAGRGLGLTMALGLLRAGANVTMVERDADVLEQAAREAGDVEGAEPVVTCHGRVGLPETGMWPLLVEAVSPPSNPSIVMALEPVSTSMAPSLMNEAVTRPLPVRT